MRHRSPVLVSLLTIITASLYGLYWYAKTKKDSSNVLNKGLRRIWMVCIPATLVLLLIPLDILTRMLFLTKPGFLQPEIYGAGVVLVLATAAMCGRKQAQINADLQGAMHGTVAYQPTQPQPVATASPSVAPSVQPVVPVSMSGSSWQQGISTIAPTVQAPAAVNPAQPVVAQPQVQAPQVIAPTVITPTNSQPH